MAVPLSISTQIGVFRRRQYHQRRPTPRFSYTQYAKFEHDSGEWLSVFLNPMSNVVPAVLLRLHPPPMQLFHPATVIEICTEMASHLHLGPLMLSKVELAFDFAMDPLTFTHLAAVLYVPRIRKRTTMSERHDPAPTQYLGARWGSRRQVKTYWKEHPGHEAVGRVEITWGAKGLRRLGATRLADLTTLDWPRIVSRVARFVDLDITGWTNRHHGVWVYYRDALWGRVHDALDGYPPGVRRQLKRRLVRLPVQDHIENACATLNAENP